MNRLQNLREDNDLNQENIAKILHCDQSTYSRYETENTDIPVSSLKELAILFNTSTDYILGLTDEKKPYKRSKKYNSK